MVHALELGKAPPLSDLIDVRSLVRRARSEAVLSADKLRDVARTLHGLKRLRDSLIALDPHAPTLSQRSFQVHDQSPLAFDIDAAIDHRGRVVDSASRELARVRHEMEKLERRIRSHIVRLLRSDAVKRALSYPNFTITGSHYVLPVARDHRHDITGVVHRTSASGDTLFIEPAEVAELSSELALLRSHESKEVKRILRQLSAALGKQARAILESLEIAAELCCVYAKARYARDLAMVQPRISDGGELCLEQARHPVLEHVCRTQSTSAQPDGEATPREPLPQSAIRPGAPGQSAIPTRTVPISGHLGGRFDVLVVTGPNTGGKTVALKTVGLLAVMAQAGLHIPAAEGSTLPIFDQVLADIGDKQSIEQSLSTFSSHVSRIASILKNATSGSLILLDELGAGTDPAEGAALGRAILDHILQSGAKGVVTTHLGDLKLYALSHPRAENAAVQFDPDTLRPTYHLKIGDTGQSSALIIARRLDLPCSLVDRAEQYLSSSLSDRPQEIRLLEDRRAEAEAARLAAWQAEQGARRAKEAFDARVRELDQHAADAQALERFRAGLRPGDTVHVLKFRRPGTIQHVDHKRRVATVSHGSMQWELSWEELLPEPR
ncbi:MAG: DNA strand exchange inhibitor protein [Planctomycetes bacterium]|nr:DNA strand exchange inhibitor protein [Planctomycetota bacterium]